MDFDSSTKFISSLAKFLQSLCNGYVEFDNGVEVIGHIYLSVDTGKKIDYVLNEKVCKTHENSVTFISNSFHAQPAERPKPEQKDKKDQLSSNTNTTNTNEKCSEETVVDNTNTPSPSEPQSTNKGTVLGNPLNFSQSSSSFSTGIGKRSYPHSSLSHNQNQTAGPSSSKQSRLHKPPHYGTSSGENRFSSSQVPGGSGSDHSKSSSHNSFSISSHDVPKSASLSGASGYAVANRSKSTSKLNPEDSADQDIKPVVDTDITFVKEEFTQGNGFQSQGGPEETYQSDVYGANQQFGGQDSSFADGDQSEFFEHGDDTSMSHLDGMGDAGDPSRLFPREKPSSRLPGKATTYSGLFPSSPGLSLPSSSGGLLFPSPSPPKSGTYICEYCDKTFRKKEDCEGHMFSTHLNQKLIPCLLCDKSFNYKKNLIRHQRMKHTMILPEFKSDQN